MKVENIKHPFIFIVGNFDDFFLFSFYGEFF
jgi:hypothetical protein